MPGESAVGSSSFDIGLAIFLSISVGVDSYTGHGRLVHQPPAQRRPIGSNTSMSLVDSNRFCYNSLHDIESTWWVGVWIITCNGIKIDKTSESAVEEAEEQKRLARRHFPQTMRSTSDRPTGRYRSSLLSANAVLESLIQHFPTPLFVCGVLLDRARDQLLGCYQEAEVNAKIDNHAFDGIHGKINAYFERAVAKSSDHQLCYLDKLIPLLKQLAREDDERSSRFKAGGGVGKKRKLSERDSGRFRPC
jgi:hypothetical protein